MATDIDDTPFRLYVDEDWADAMGRTDVVVLSVTIDEDVAALELPQFDLEVTVDRGDFDADREDAIRALLDQAIRRLLSYWVALREMPADHITWVEEAQLLVIEERFMPAFARLLAMNPGYFETPPLGEVFRTLGASADGMAIA